MKIVFAGGGTGGHINPALSIAEYVKQRDENFEAVFVGTDHGLEKKLVPKAGYELKFIDIEGFSRKNMLKNLYVLKKLNDAKRDSVKIIKEFKPDCVVCTGGYVSGPVAMAAKKAGVPALIHEQNVYPGLTVKGSEKYVEYIAVSFDETLSHLSAQDKCVVTGNPVRPEILEADSVSAKREFGSWEKPFVLVFGGSLGAKRINDTVIEMLARVAEEGKFRFLFGTGDRNYEEVMAKVEELGITLSEDSISVVPYIDNMASVMAAADVVVARSGAITVSELAVLGKPSVLIPSPNVVRNHQEQNAREIEKNGAAVVITEDELSADKLYDTLVELISDKDKLDTMSECALKLAKPNALDKIYELILNMTGKKEGNR